MYCIHIYKNALCCTQLLIGVVWGLAMLNWNPTKLNLTCYTLTYFACQVSVSNAKMRSNVVSNQQCHLSVGYRSRNRHLTLLTYLLKQWHQSNRPPGETSSSSTVILIITSFSFRDKLYYCFFANPLLWLWWMVIGQSVSIFKRLEWNDHCLRVSDLVNASELDILETVEILWRSKFLLVFSASENSLPSERWTMFSVCISHHWPSP